MDPRARPLLRLARALLLAPALLAGGSGVASAQGPHPLPPQSRPLHQRLELADAVLVARIGPVGPGRIEVETERALLGEIPERFPVKRSPSDPPPLREGDRAILLLRGARPPFVLVDAPRETIRLADPASARRWSDAVAALVEHRDEPRAVLDLYVDWLEGGPATLRELGMRGLTDPEASFQPIPEEVWLGRAEVAADPERPDDARRAAAFLAARSAAATERLLARTPGPGEGAVEVAVTVAALQGGAVHRSEALAPALRRSFRHPSPEVRRGALRVAAAVPLGVVPELQAEVAGLVEREPDDGVRQEAERTLAALQRRQARAR